MNVLLTNWDTPFGLPPFASIRDEDFGPAFDEALTRARAAIGAIAEGPGTSFAEVIDALELAEGDLDRVGGVFYNLAGADSTEAREALMRELAPKTTCLGGTPFEFVQMGYSRSSISFVSPVYSTKRDLSLKKSKT